MMNSRKLLPMTAIFALFFGLIGSATAQQAPICLGLGEEDCALYNSLTMDSALPTSTAFELDTNVTVSGATPEPAVFDVLLTGAYVFDEAEAQAAVDAFGALSVLDVNLRSLLDLTEGVVDAFDAELTVDLSGLPEGSTLGLPITELNLWLVDGIGYLDLTQLAMLLGPDAEGVFGIDPFELIETPLTGVTMERLFALGEMMGSGFGNPALNPAGGNDAVDAFTQGFQQGFQAGMAGAALTEEDLAGFATVERLADEDGLAVFVTTIDLAATLNADFVREQTIASIEQAGLPENVEAEALVDAISASFAGSTVTVTERFNVEEGLFVSGDFVMDMTFNLSTIAEALGEMPEEEMVLDIDVTSIFTRSDINAVEAITLPEGATIVPLGQLMGGNPGA